ncbi:hypothetical protein WN944_006077 [Citrus x changshan-huyou]|uniref:Uncharacterized protein n=1 Tax=Citrus x changshan-huyou TaxID=2935761 RepID=A0AAP0MKM1_9ROSI
MREKNGERFANGSLSTTVSEEKSTGSKMGPFPSNHRYQNCRDSYDDEEDEDDMAHIGKNLTQWKAVKARTAAVPQLLRKENNGLQQEAQVPSYLTTSSNLYSFNLAPNHNQSKPLLHEIAVDASLSNWLASSNRNESKTSIINNSRSCSRQSREDIPIIDITNLKASTT